MISATAILVNAATALPLLNSTSSGEVGRALHSNEDLYFRLHGYDGCLECLYRGGAVYGKRIERRRTDEMKEAGITHDRYEYHDGDYCLPEAVCSSIKDALHPDKPCFKVKDENRATYPSQLCAGNPDCDPEYICAKEATCFDGKLYPTKCGPSNCDVPIMDTCPPSEPVFATVKYGTCQSHGMLPITTRAECQQAAADSPYDVQVDSTGYVHRDIVDGCSVHHLPSSRLELPYELFWNPKGACNPFDSSRWSRGCVCSDLNPCLCKANTECVQDEDPFCFKELVDGQCLTICF